MNSRPLKSTPKAFSELVIRKVAERGLKKYNQICGTLRIGSATWSTIQKQEIPDFRNEGNRKKDLWIMTITRLCDHLALDLKSCLKACRLAFDQEAIDRGRIPNRGPNPHGQELTETDLLALLARVRKERKPICVTDALHHIAQLRKACPSTLA